MNDAPLIVGCGDLGLRLAQRLLDAGLPVRAVVRSPDSAAALRTRGVTAQALDLDASQPLPAAPQVWWFAPPPAHGRQDPRLRRWLDTAGIGAKRVVYVSTSGVYGDCQGRWIDEDEPLKPQTERGHRRLDAELALREHAARHGTEIVILRVPGIYGPGRLPRERLERGLPVVQESECPWTNRIHVDDLAQIAELAMQRGRPGAAYNVSDGHPSTMTDYFTRCALRLGLPTPPRVSLQQARTQFTPAMLSFLEESKRLINRRMLDELGVALRYPDLAAGLAACGD